ncbi:MAG: Rpn family recombination-promoting nuclease/putative transposase [Chloroflexota bacterium]
MKFVNPKNDVAFKKIFGSEDKSEVLIGFLNAVLDLHGDQAIQTIRMRNPYQTPKIALLKQSILDIYATDNRGFTFIVEMQVANIASAFKRFTYYVTKEYSSQIQSGEDYPKLTPVIFVGIFDFVLFAEVDNSMLANGTAISDTISADEIPQTAKYATTPGNIPGTNQADGMTADYKAERKHTYLSCHKLLDEETHQHQLKDLSFYFIELPKFTKQEDELNHILDKWVYFIRYADDLDVVPTHVEEPALQTAYELANQFSWKKEDLDQYEYRGIKIQDERGALTLAKEEGREEGRIEIAKNMLSLGLSIKQITESTGLSAEEIQRIQAK